MPYFDLSLQHVSRPLLKRMRRWGEGDRFLDRIGSIRAAEPTAAFRSSFIVGYPGETEEDHDRLLAWIGEAQLDWVGFFPFSNEIGTYASGLDGKVPQRARGRAHPRVFRAAGRDHRPPPRGPGGSTMEVLVDAPGEARTYREAPEIDGVVTVPSHLPVGAFVDVVVTGADGPDLSADELDGPDLSADELGGPDLSADELGGPDLSADELDGPRRFITVPAGIVGAGGR